MLFDDDKKFLIKNNTINYKELYISRPVYLTRGSFDADL
jgi:hypothetical protein